MVSAVIVSIKWLLSPHKARAADSQILLVLSFSLLVAAGWGRYAASVGSCVLQFERWLDYCTERRLIQRVGGRYRFVHRLLQEHFAQMELPPR